MRGDLHRRRFSVMVGRVPRPRIHYHTADAATVLSVGWWPRGKAYPCYSCAAPSYGSGRYARVDPTLGFYNIKWSANTYPPPANWSTLQDRLAAIAGAGAVSSDALNVRRLRQEIVISLCISRSVSRQRRNLCLVGSGAESLLRTVWPSASVPLALLCMPRRGK